MSLVSGHIYKQKADNNLQKKAYTKRVNGAFVQSKKIFPNPILFLFYRFEIFVIKHVQGICGFFTAVSTDIKSLLCCSYANEKIC